MSEQPQNPPQPPKQQNYQGTLSSSRPMTDRVVEILLETEIAKENLKHYLYGDQKVTKIDPETKRLITVWDPTKGTKVCTQDTANRLLAFVEPIFDKNTILGWNTEKRIMQNTRNLLWEINDDIFLNPQYYTFYVKPMVVLQQLGIVIEGTLRRSLNGFTAKLISEQSQIREVYTPQQEKKKTVLAGLFG